MLPNRIKTMKTDENGWPIYTDKKQKKISDMSWKERQKEYRRILGEVIYHVEMARSFRTTRKTGTKLHRLFVEYDIARGLPERDHSIGSD